MARANGRSQNLRDKLDGNELDLSLSDLSEVPVRDLVAIPKATALDLSCNKLTTLPDDFCNLSHIVRLDLSKNQIVQLPSEFGRLMNLQHLDLLQNHLMSLPVSFAQLKSLKWLDLKDNPLKPDLAKVAGDCLDEKQCKECAQRVLQYMKSVQSDHEIELQRKLQLDKERKKKLEAKQRVKEEQEREMRKRKKQQQKERKRRDYNAMQEAERALNSNKKAEEEPTENHKRMATPKEKKLAQRQSRLRKIACILLFGLLVVLLVVVACRFTDLKAINMCTSVNAIYKETLSALHSNPVLERFLQDPSSQ
ncbi:leucine-rich repeat-containing protein 59 [Xenopus laevis]|uniref:Leucine-rich repeat-containing protein 59 n=1 Tax=Xenopus laevis TaxID=8355 RepID=LRC59_XENLA|nr:leucine-rich repeat-containing protein 59 [Xenopus laevis]Q8AVS8.1 RecName: Full=Leucine-rich repeat-containing protein 59 [Xenopus laevis]AAH41285.1 Lrrc59 protein [Xenopus laevis]